PFGVGELDSQYLRAQREAGGEKIFCADGDIDAERAHQARDISRLIVGNGLVGSRGKGKVLEEVQKDIGGHALFSWLREVELAAERKAKLSEAEVRRGAHA